MFKKIVSFIIAFSLTFTLGMPLTTAAQTVESEGNSANTFKSHFINLGGDPWVTYHDGWYYYMVTGNGFYVAKSRELQRVNSNPVAVFKLADLVDGENLSIVKELWAPELHFIDGYWYIYFTAYDGEVASESEYNGCTGKPRNHRMYVLKSKTSDAQGEYEFMGQIKELESDYINDTTYQKGGHKPGHWAIDQTVFKWNGKLYAVWSGWSAYSNIDQRIYIAEMSDPCTISSNRVELSRPEYAYETYSVVPAINEAPQALISPDGKTLNVAFSVNRFDDSHYSLGLLTLKENGNPLNADDWTKTEDPVFETSTENSTYSVGHCSFVPSPDGSEHYVVFHARRGEDTDTNPREIRVQQFNWYDNGTPCFEEPVSADAPVNLPSGTAVLNRTELEAENAVLSQNVVIPTKDSSIQTYDDDYYSGGKRVALTKSGATATFTYNAEKSGKYTLTLLAAGNSASNAGFAVTVNGKEYKQQIYGNMNNINIFGYYDISGIELNQGENEVVIGYTSTYKNGAYLDRLDITNEADVATCWEAQDKANLESTKTPVLKPSPIKDKKTAEYNKEYTFNDFGDFDKYWYSSEPFVDDPEYENVITTCRAGGNKRLFVSGEEFKNISDFKSSVEIIPAAAHENANNPSIPVADETAINSGILFRVGKMTDYTSNVCTFDGYRCFLVVSNGVVKMQLSRYYFASETATQSTNKLLKTATDTLAYTPGDTYVIELTCVGNTVDAIAYNTKAPDTVIKIENQSIITPVAETLDNGKIGLFTNCVSRVTFANFKLKSYDKQEAHSSQYSQVSDFDIKTNAPTKMPTSNGDGIVTSTGALKMQALDEAVTYTEKTFTNLYSKDSYDLYGNKYNVANYGATFDAENGIITTADSKTKAKIIGTEGMTDFSTEFTITKLVSKSLYGGISFRMQDSDFRTDTFGTSGYMLFVTSAETSKDVKINLRKYSTATTHEIDVVTATGLLGVATNGVNVKIAVAGKSISITVADAQNAESTYSTEFTLVPDSTASNATGTYYDSGSLAYVFNGNHTLEDLSLTGKVPTNYIRHEKALYNLYDENYYTVYGNTGDETTNYGVTFAKNRISGYSQSKVKLNGHSNIEDFKAEFTLKKTNGNALYGGIGFRLQDAFFTKATFATPGYLLFAYSATDSMDVTLKLRNYISTSYAESVVTFENFLAAPAEKNIRMEVEVIGETLSVTIYDISDYTRCQTTTFALKSTNTKAGNFKGGSIAFVSNGTHDFTDISISETVKEAPFTIVENFTAEADFTLPESNTIQCGIMFGVQNTVNRTPGLTAFSLNAIRTTNSENNAISLQLVRYGTTTAGDKNINLGAIATDAVSNLLTNTKGTGDKIRIKLMVARGTVYYSVLNVVTNKESKTFSVSLLEDSVCQSDKNTYSTAYSPGGIGIFTNLANVTVSNLNVTELADCKVNIENSVGGTVTGSATYCYSEQVTVAAKADYGYYFDGWYKDSELLTKNEEYTFTVTQSITLTPQFIAFPLRYSGTDVNNKAAMINLDSLDGVTEVGFEVTAKSEDDEISVTLSTNYINTDAVNKTPWLATSNKVYYCDINNDGIADSLDLVSMRKGLLKLCELNGTTADLTENDSIDIRDLICFKEALADTMLTFETTEDGFNYPFVIATLLNPNGNQYIELKPYSITNGKKTFAAPVYLSYNGTTLETVRENANHTPFGKVRIACVGDSITQGVGATGWASGDYSYAYPQQLGGLLGDSCLVGNFGRGGSYVYHYEGRSKTLWYPNTSQYTDSNNFDADIVIIKLGTNDAKVMTGKETSAAWKEQFTELVNHYKNLESKPAIYIMSSITMLNYDASLEQNLINYILPHQKDVAEELGCTFLDAYTDLYDIFSSGEGFASDGLHPNDTGYAAMAEYVKENISIDIFY